MGWQLRALSKANVLWTLEGGSVQVETDRLASEAWTFLGSLKSTQAPGIKELLCQVCRSSWQQELLLNSLFHLWLQTGEGCGAHLSLLVFVVLVLSEVLLTQSSLLFSSHTSPAENLRPPGDPAIAVPSSSVLFLKGAKAALVLKSSRTYLSSSKLFLSLSVCLLRLYFSETYYV